MSNKVEPKTSLSEYERGMIHPFNEHGGKVINLKNEFNYADLSISKPQLDALLFSMSLFDTEDFLRSDVVLNRLYTEEAGWDFRKIDQDLTDEVYSAEEYRTVVVDAYKLNKIMNGPDSKTNNKSRLEKSIKTLQSTVIKIDHRKTYSEPRKRIFLNPFEASFIDDEADPKRRKVVFTFSSKFMPYVVAFSGYNKLDLNVIRQLKSTYAVRYYQWIVHEAELKKGKPIPISVLRKRLGVPEDAHKRGFYNRVVLEPIEELKKVTGLELYAERVVDSTKKGRPLTAIKFGITPNDSEQVKTLKEQRDKLFATIVILDDEVLKSQLQEKIDSINLEIEKLTS